MKLGEFFISLVVDSAAGELSVKGLISRIGELEAVTIGEIGTLTELANALAEITEHTIETALGIEKVTKSSSISAEVLQRWGRVALLTTTATAEDVGDALQMITHDLADFRISGVPSQSLDNLSKLFGIDIIHAKDADQVLMTLKRTIMSMHDPIDILSAKLRAANIKDDLLPMFQMPWDQFNKEGGYVKGISTEQVARFAEIDKVLLHIKELSGQIKVDIADWGSGPLLTTLQALLGIFKRLDEYIEAAKAIESAGKMIATATGVGVDTNKFMGIPLSGLLDVPTFFKAISSVNEKPDWADVLKGGPFGTAYVGPWQYAHGPERGMTVKLQHEHKHKHEYNPDHIRKVASETLSDSHNVTDLQLDNLLP